jgi:hypothetical protein
VLGGHDQIGTHHHLEATGNGDAVHRSDHRFRELVEQPQSLAHHGHVLPGGERLEIHAGAEDLLAGTGDDHRPHGGVGGGIGEGGHETAAHLGIERVPRLWAVDGEHECPISKFDEQAHGSLLTWPTDRGEAPGSVRR